MLALMLSLRELICSESHATKDLSKTQITLAVDSLMS